jgi:hypothetical protein
MGLLLGFVACAGIGAMFLGECRSTQIKLYEENLALKAQLELLEVRIGSTN